MLIDGKLYLWLALVAFPSLILAGCGEDNNPENLRCRVRAVAGPEDDVVGKWKLVRVRQAYFTREPEVTDYSCDDIVYHFRSDGSLVVNNSVTEAAHHAGDYNYEFIWDPFDSGASSFRGLKIAHNRWGCSVETTMMTLDASPTDGPKMEFIRID